MNIHKLSAVLAAGVAGGTLLLSASAAGAATAPAHGHAGGREVGKSAVLSAAPQLPSALPKGYTLVTSDFTAFAGAQDADTTWCPGTEQPVGGGAIVSSSDLQVNINRSYPDVAGGWTVSISNASAASTPVTAYAICMAYSPYDQIVSATASVGPGSVNSQAVVCPAHTGVLGGGAYSYSPATDVYMNSTVPNTFAGGRTGWRVAMASSDPSSANFIVYAVCRPKPKGYSIQWGQMQQVGPYTEGGASVTCPGTSVPITGGGFTDYTITDAWLAMNSSGPYGQGWVVYENNDEDVTRGVEAVAICAGS